MTLLSISLLLFRTLTDSQNIFDKALRYLDLTVMLTLPITIEIKNLYNSFCALTIDNCNHQNRVGIFW